MSVIDYYIYNIGIRTNEEVLSNIEKTIGYLSDNNFSNKEIIDILFGFNGMNDIAIKNLPDKLWDGSLLKRNVFYYHSQLHITSHPPYFDVIEQKRISPKFFLEMKIRYTPNDILNYIYSNLKDLEKYSDFKKDIGAVNYLLGKYKKYDFMEPVDFLLFLIDEAYYQYRNVNAKFTDILEIDSFKINVIDKLDNKVKSAEAEHKNKIIWR